MYMCHARSAVLWGWKNKAFSGPQTWLLLQAANLQEWCSFLKLGAPDLNCHLSFSKARKSTHYCCHVSPLWLLPWLTKLPYATEFGVGHSSRRFTYHLTQNFHCSCGIYHLETGFQYVDQTGLELSKVLPQFLTSCDYKHEMPCPL